MRRSFGGVLVSFALAGALMSWRGGAAENTVQGKVIGPNLKPVAGATVYFIEGGQIDATPITAKGILDGTAEPYDEALEDVLRHPQKSAQVPKALTDAEGKFVSPTLKADAGYFPYVVPAETDKERMPGGDASRTAFTLGKVPAEGLQIKLSGAAPAGASYVGSTKCLECHERPKFKSHGHQLGFQVPGKRTPFQDVSRHKDFDVFLQMFKEAKAHTDPGVKSLFFEDFDKARSFDKFKLFEDASGGGTVYAKAYLWKENEKYKVTFENVLNPKDPKSPWTLNVALTYGGAVHKQRLILEVPDRKGRYPWLQFQGYEGSKGSAANYDRGRKQFRDYKMDFYFGPGPDNNMGTADDLLKLPPPNQTWEGQCAQCHFTGFKPYKDAGTGELLAHAVNDKNGGFDLEGDGKPDEINMGCEVCHGPGSAHAVKDSKQRHILNPSLLSAERASLICAHCHERHLSASGMGLKEGSFNKDDAHCPPGASRAEFLAQFASQKSYSLKELWPDEVHAKAHRAQYSTWLKSKHARNTRQLVACDDCHDTHGDSPARWFLKDATEADGSTPCLKCHQKQKDVQAHAKDSAKCTVEKASCVSCHMTPTVQSGAGEMGLRQGKADEKSTENNTYWQGDIGSHLMDVPRKTSKGVAGVVPGKAMPVPYTNRCGRCHDVSKLKELPPAP